MGDGILHVARAPGGWQGQSAVTVVAEVTRTGLDAVRRVLFDMSADPAGNAVLAFGRLAGTHFARFFVTGEVTGPDGTTLPAHLVFMADVDGSAGAYLEHVVDVGGDGMDTLFRHCTGYPVTVGGSVGRAARLAYLVEHTATGGVNYVNTIGRTVAQVRAEAALYERLEGFADLAHGRLRTMTATAARAAIIAFVSGEPDLRWALTPPPPPSIGHRLGTAAHFTAPVVVAVLLLPIAIPALIAWLLVLRAHERGDPSPPLRPDETHLSTLRSLEDHGVQNQFTALGFVKPGWFRGCTARAVLNLVGFGARHIFNRGTLAGVTTIHFARWVPLDGRTRILFCSNYDGSTESYMDDFIDKVAWGLNATFSNGTGYPATRWLLLGGAGNEEAFKGFLRTRQLPTQVWYSACPGSTAVNIGTHARVRAGLSGHMSDLEAQAWLRLL